MTDDRLRTFLADTLSLWRVQGTVAPGEGRVIAVILTRDGTSVGIERAREGMPFRWLAHSRRAGEMTDTAREPQARTAASIVGLLNAIRRALGVERGRALRIAPSPDGT